MYVSNFTCGFRYCSKVFVLGHQLVDGAIGPAGHLARSLADRVSEIVVVIAIIHLQR